MEHRSSEVVGKWWKIWGIHKRTEDAQESSSLGAWLPCGETSLTVLLRLDVPNEQLASCFLDLAEGIEDGALDVHRTSAATSSSAGDDLDFE